MMAATSTAPTTKKLIKSALIGAGLQQIDRDVLSKCVALSSLLHLSPETMAEVWEAHSLNKQNLTQLTMHQFEAYKNELIKASSTTAGSTPDLHHSSNVDVNNDKTTTPRGATIISRKSAIKREAPMVTPMASAKRHQTSPPDVAISSSGSPPNNGTSSVDRVAIDTSNSPSPVRSSLSSSASSTTVKTEKKPMVLPKYEERTKVGYVVTTYPPNQSSDGSSNISSSNTKTGRRRCVLSTSTTTKTGESTSTWNEENGNKEEEKEKEDTNDITRHNITKRYRHMFTTMDDRATALEKHLVQMKDAIVNDIGNEINENNSNKEKNNNMNSNENDEGPAPFEEVNVPRQDPSTCIGRVCNEAHQGKINATSVVLEGSSSTSGGARVNIDMSQMKQQQQQLNKAGYSLFPGQIIAVEGMNGTGRKITAAKIREGAPIPPVSTSVREMKSYYYDNNKSSSNNSNEEQPAPLKIISACGPFTTSKDMDYAPFIDLLNVVIDQKPDVVILTGPFVDVRQEIVQSGRSTIDIDDGNGLEQKIVVSYEAVFADKIAACIEEFLTEGENDQTEFVLVPALEDATAECVYPQPPFQDRLEKGGKFLNIPGADDIEFGSLGLHSLAKHQKNGNRRVHCLSNPCTFRINELVFGVTSTDVLFHISVEETNANLPVGSRLRRIAQHLVHQQSYYPLFPPNKSVNLDLKQQDGWKMPCKPDVLIVPSKLTPFCAPILGSTIAINPGHLTKGTTGGTYAVMEIKPMSREKLEAHAADDTTVLPHEVQDRMQAEIKRI